MNKKRRARLERIWSSKEEIIDEEQDAFDNLPEGIQCSEKGESMESGLEALVEINELLSEITNG